MIRPLVRSTLVLAALAAPVRAAEWTATFASDSDTVVFVGAEGELWRAPFHLAARETLWTPSGTERLARLLVSPAGGSVAWLTRAGDRTKTTLWAGRAGRAVPRMVYQSLVPHDYSVLRYEASLPTLEDPGVRGARFVKPNVTQRALSTNALEWTSAGDAIVFGYDQGLGVAPVDSGPPRRVSPALVTALRLLDPAPIYLAEVLRMGDELGPGATAAEEELEREATRVPGSERIGKARDLAHERTPETTSYLLYPTGATWRAFPASGLDASDPWTASPATVWWAEGSHIRAVSASNPTPRVDVESRDPVAWIEYDPSHRALLWASGKHIERRGEDGGPITPVLATAARIRTVLAPGTGSLRGVVAGDSLVIWNPADGSRRAAALAGVYPEAVFEGPAGECVVESAPGKREGKKDVAPRLYRADVDARKLTPIETPTVKDGRVVATPRGDRLVLFAPGARPPATLHVYDLASGTWSDVSNPGLAGWEPLSSR